MNLNLRFYWALLLRRLPVMLALFLISSGIGIAIAYSRPDTYTATARLSITDAQISTPGQRTSPDADREQLQIIQQRLMTRSNLIDIARRFNVFDREDNLSPDEIVENMQTATTISMRSGRGQATLMTISFRAETGRLSADVVNEYVTLIQDYSARQTDEIVTNRLRFREREVARLSENIDLQSGRIVTFKSQNACCLPDDLPNRLTRQARLQERLIQQNRDRDTLEAQREDIVRLYENTGQVAPAQAPQTPAEQQLASLNLRLTQLLTVYSEESFRVRSLRNQISALEEVVAGQKIEEQSEGAENLDLTGNTSLDVALLEIDNRLEVLQKDRETTENQLTALNESIAATTTNAITLDGLEREYRNLQGLYDRAVQDLNLARTEEQVQIQDRGQRIDVFENAAVPSEPTGPNRIALSAMGIGFGGGLAAAYFVLLELLNRTIRRPAEIRSKFGIIPIATIPYMESRRQKLMRRGALLASSVVVLIAVPALLWYVDQYYQPLDLLLTQVLSKVGLS